MTGTPPPDADRQGLLARLDAVLVERPLLVILALYPVFLAVGFALTKIGTSNWDSIAHHHYQLWLTGQWRGEELPLVFERAKWRAPLPEYLLAGFNTLFSFLRDELWVRHAATFSYLPATLLGAYALLRRAGETAGTALLALALVAADVRLLGHALLNEQDFPFTCGYLLVTLAMAAVFIRRFQTPARLLDRPGTFSALAVLSVVPYLLRVPVAFHWLLLVGVGVWVALFAARGASLGRRLLVGLVPVVVGPLVVFVASPGLWEHGPLGMFSAVRLYSRFPWVGPVRLFGMEFLSTDLPLWYGPVWVAVSWVPVGLLVLLVGLVFFVRRTVVELARSRPWPLSPLFRSLAVWVAVFGATPWVAALVLRPTLYDEDRHLLFAMPLLGVAAALGLRDLPGRVKGVAAAVVLVAALWSAASWGTYAYVYKNPLLPRTSGSDFMGDYWGISAGALAQALYDHVPDRGYVYMIGPRETLTREIERRERSLGVRAPETKTFDLRQRARRRGQMYVAAVNRNDSCRPILEDVARGRARELWRGVMPGGDVAAILVYYEDRCDDCPERLTEHLHGGG